MKVTLECCPNPEPLVSFRHLMGRFYYVYFCANCKHEELIHGAGKKI